VVVTAVVVAVAEVVAAGVAVAEVVAVDSRITKRSLASTASGATN
jgi:hypothetical protein